MRPIADGTAWNGIPRHNQLFQRIRLCAVCHVKSEPHISMLKAADVSVLAVFSALSIASSKLRPQRSVRQNKASALTTTARSSRS